MTSSSERQPFESETDTSVDEPRRTQHRWRQRPQRFDLSRDAPTHWAGPDDQLADPNTNTHTIPSKISDPASIRQRNLRRRARPRRTNASRSEFGRTQPASSINETTLSLEREHEAQRQVTTKPCRLRTEARTPKSVRRLLCLLQQPLRSRLLTRRLDRIHRRSRLTLPAWIGVNGRIVRRIRIRRHVGITCSPPKGVGLGEGAEGGSHTRIGPPYLNSQ